jgi:hypothetical protein
MYSCRKMETIPQMGGRRIKENGEFNHDILEKLL